MADIDVERVLQQLTVDEKVALTAGSDFWHTVPIPRLGVPSIRVSDGPNGVRGTKFFDGIPAACLPNEVGLAATWNNDLMAEIGELLAEEAKAKGAHVLLGPTLNIQRSPLGGRAFESFSEDPLLSGKLTASYVKGLQSKNIAATLKHYVCNDQENERHSVNVIVSERALREIYLQPFQIATREANPKCYMTSYSRLEGKHGTEQKRMMEDVLRREWGWDGLIMSDWFGVTTTSDSINAGLDLEMPGPTVWRGPLLKSALYSKNVTPNTLDERVRNILKLVKYAAGAGIPADNVESGRNIPETGAFLRKLAAETCTLLKNDKSVLPLSKSKKVLIIGPSARIANYCGGGSASLKPYYAISPYDAFVEKLGKDNVEFTIGAYSHKLHPSISPMLVPFESGEKVKMSVYLESPEIKDRKPVDSKSLDDFKAMYFDYTIPVKDHKGPVYMKFEAVVKVPESGKYSFGISGPASYKLYLDGELILDDWTNKDTSIPSDIFAGEESVAESELIQNQEHKITVEFKSAAASLSGYGSIDLGFVKCIDPVASIKEAADLAKNYEQVVVVTGTNKDWESEGHDRTSIDLPPHNDALVEAVIAANPNAVIIVQSGSAVALPWADRAATILHGPFGGNEVGNGIADIVFGDVNPSGKLPITYPRRIEDTPAFFNYSSDKGRVLYGEDVYVGYRYYEKKRVEPQFAFGHGLSYTTFKIENASASAIIDGKITISVDVTNTGKLAGAETVQVYVSQDKPSLNRPVKELKGYTKVFLQPGETKKSTVVLEVKYVTSYWNELEDSWTSDAGDYTVLVGNSSVGPFVNSNFSVPKTTYWRGA